MDRARNVTKGADVEEYETDDVDVDSVDFLCLVGESKLSDMDIDIQIESDIDIEIDMMCCERSTGSSD